MRTAIFIAGVMFDCWIDAIYIAREIKKGWVWRR